MGYAIGGKGVPGFSQSHLGPMAHKSQITGPQYDDMTSWPSGLGNVCQCMPTSVVGGFNYFVVIIAPLF